MLPGQPPKVHIKKSQQRKKKKKPLLIFGLGGFLRTEGKRTVSECDEYSMFLRLRLAGLSSDHTEHVLS